MIYNGKDYTLIPEEVEGSCDGCAFNIDGEVCPLDIGDGEIVCIDADYEIAVLIWHKLLNSVKQIQLELF